MKNEIKHMNPLPIIAAVVVVAAVAVTLMPKKSVEQTPLPSEPLVTEDVASPSGNDIVIQVEDIGTEASYFDYDADGTTVQVFAVQASDGTVRLALNTCQVCNGSPYAYFEQEGDYFICQNCGNRFASTEIGIANGGCRPVPITEDIYTQQDGTIIIPESYLKENAPLFKNWKKF